MVSDYDDYRPYDISEDDDDCGDVATASEQGWTVERDHSAEIDDLKDRVAELEAMVSGGLDRAKNYFEVADVVLQVKRMTSDVFDIHYDCMERSDAEVANDRHFTFRVVCTEAKAEALKRFDEWHNRLSEIPVDLRPMFCLSIDLGQ